MAATEKPPLPTFFAPAERAEASEVKRLAHLCLENPVARAILDVVSGYALILNAERQIVAANAEVIEALGVSDSKAMLGLRLGEAVHCVHKEDCPGGCGTSQACAHCGAVLTILASQTTDAPAMGECLLSMIQAGAPAAGEYKIRCSPVHLAGEELTVFVLQDQSGQKRREILEHIFFHEVQNLAGDLDGTAQELLAKPENAKLTARQIREMATQLSQEVLAQRILLSAEDGTLIAEKRDLSVSEVMDEIGSLFASHDVAKGRSLDLDGGPEGTLYSDPVLLTRVLFNLVKNAFEAVSEGVLVSLKHHLDGAGHRFDVHNPGVMSEAVRTRIFQRSFSTKALRGRGLGTFSAKLLTEKFLGGRLEFMSTAEAGTTFSLRLPPISETGNVDHEIQKMPEAGPLMTRSGVEPGTVLVIDDSKTVRQILISVLSKENRVLSAASGQEGLAMAQEKLPDLIILDVVMPGLDGYAVCARLKSDPRTAEIPVLFLSILGGEEDETLALEAGAIDFITKPISPAAVAARVRNHLELKHSKDRLRDLSLLDGLTGIANRRRFDQHLESEWRRCIRKGSPLSLVLGDVDFFKRYNDGYGHAKGDECLRAVAQAFAASLQRPGDLAARYGGEEFICILPETHLDGALGIAERIRANVANLKIPHAHSEASTVVSVSLGVASLVPLQDGKASALMLQADEKLYEAKRSGRNRVCG